MSEYIDPVLVGMLVGLALGIVSMAIMRGIARRMEGGSPTDGQRRTAGWLRIGSVFDVLLFVAVGYYVGSLIAG